MATFISSGAKKLAMDGFLNFDYVELLNDVDDVNRQNQTETLIGTMAVSALGVWSNTQAITFNMLEGKKVFRVRVLRSSDNANVIMNFTDVPVGGFDFVTAGTFTIPIGGLTITVGV